MSKKNKEKEKFYISFSKISVILMYIMVIGFFAFIALTQAYPPTEFIIAWMGFWCIQAIVTAVLEINNRGHKDKITFIEAIVPYINEENVSTIIEKYLGVEPQYKKAKNVKQIENREV